MTRERYQREPTSFLRDIVWSVAIEYHQYVQGTASSDYPTIPVLLNPCLFFYTPLSGYLPICLYEYQFLCAPVCLHTPRGVPTCLPVSSFLCASAAKLP